MDFKKIYHNKAIVASFISVITIVLVGIVSIPELPFVGSVVQSANLGIKNILLSEFGGNYRANTAITVVAIDNKSLSDTEGLGRFQDFKRSYYAKVIDNLKKDGALVIGVDILLSETSKEDDMLARSISDAGNVVLGFSLTEKLYPISPFGSGALGMGYFHPERNAYNGTVYSIVPEKPGGKAFSFVVAQKYFDAGGMKNIAPLKIRSLSAYPFEGSSKNRLVPYISKDARDVFINYLPQGADFQKISFIDAYNGSYPKNLVQGKVILIGSTATALYDKFNTPLGIQDGIFVHANMVNTILNQKYIVEMEQWKEILVLVALTFLVVLAVLHVKNRASQILYMGFGFILFSALEAGYFILFQRLFTFPIQLILIVVLTTIFVTTYKYMYEEEGKRLLKNTLSQYLAEDLVMNVLENYEEVKLGGTRKMITSFFSDIEGFTTISENMEPEELVHFLSIYLKEVSDVIMHERGFINKYEGDAVMALWGVFGDEQEQSLLACRAALLQQEKILELNTEFKKTHGFEIRVRMGINKGDAVVGNIGSMGKKIEYTALGDSVNTASRFEGINKVYGTLICVGESVMESTKDFFVYRKLDNIQVKGKEKPVLIYELIGEKGKVSVEKIEMIKEFERALMFYTIGNIQEAKDIFMKLTEKAGDAPSCTFLNRCEKLMEKGLPPGWIGVYRATEK